MAFSDEYEKLGDKDREQFGAVVNALLCHTFIIRQTGGDGRYNEDYYFAHRNIELINEYLEVIGCKASDDTLYGVFYLSSFPDQARTHFDKLTTQMIYTLRLIYEEKRDELQSASVVITVGEFITKMLETELITKKPANKDIAASLRRIENASIISKDKGQYDNENTKIMILPSILMVLSDSKLKATLDKLKGADDAEEAEDEEA